MPEWLSSRSAQTPGEAADDGEAHLALARESLQELLDDERVPAEVRDSLADDYAQVETLLDKLENGHIHIAVFGRVSVGKSALVNALLGESRFATSPLHGETRSVQRGQWQEYRDGNVYLIDTPGINEVAGETREQLAREVASRADLVLFVVDGDLTQAELLALQALAETRRPLILVLNKADRYSEQERESLGRVLLQHSAGLLQADDLIFTAAQPAMQWVIRTDPDGTEHESQRQPPPDVERLKARLWQVLEDEGKTLSALNATLFAGQLSDTVAERVLTARRTLGDRVIRTWCIAKGVAVALNPVPVADLVAAAVVDISMVVHLSRTYGLPLTRSEAGGLIKTIGAQMVLLMGTVWAVHLVSSALKLGTGGLSAAGHRQRPGRGGLLQHLCCRPGGRTLSGERQDRGARPDQNWRCGRSSTTSIAQSILDQAKADIRARLGLALNPSAA